MNFSKKKLISEMIEDWYVADHILFGGIPRSYIKSNKLYESYLNLKKNYFETLFEMYNLVGYTSKYIECPKNDKQLQLNALNTIKEARILAAKTLIKESKNFSKVLKESKEENIQKNVKKLQLSCQFESAFMNSQLKTAKKINNINDPKFILLKNCLNECKKELINYSIKYMK